MIALLLTLSGRKEVTDLNFLLDFVLHAYYSILHWLRQAKQCYKIMLQHTSADGLFTDGIPLAFSIFSANQNEQQPLKPLEETVLQKFGHSQKEVKAGKIPVISPLWGNRR